MVFPGHYDPGRELEDLLLAKLISTAERPKIDDVSRGIIKTLIDYSAHWRKDNDNPALANFLKPFE